MPDGFSRVQYFVPFAKDGINRQIELAINRADKMGVKVLSLAALNKVGLSSLSSLSLSIYISLSLSRMNGIYGRFDRQNESLNGGGVLYVKKNPDLRVRVVHGNTLTAGVILYGIPSDVTEVFLTGATSKLGRAIALYLCRKGIRVLVNLFYGYQPIMYLSVSICQRVSIYRYIYHPISIYLSIYRSTRL